MNITQPPLSPIPIPAQPQTREDIGTQQRREETKQAEISLRTDEGDVITISGFNSEAFAATGSLTIVNGQEQTVAARSYTHEQYMQLSVVGDLNAKEIADINRVLGHLGKIAASFFNGKLDRSIEEALNIKDLGSLAELSATFIHSVSASSQLSWTHPIAKFSPEAMGQLADLTAETQNEAAVGRPNIDFLKSQWEKIKDILGQAIKEINEKTPPVLPEKDFTDLDRMFTQVKEMLGSRPDYAAKLEDLFSQVIAVFNPLSTLGLPSQRHVNTGPEPSPPQDPSSANMRKTYPNLPSHRTGQFQGPGKMVRSPL